MTTRRLIWARPAPLLVVLVAAALGVLRWLLPERSLTTIGWRAVWDALFSMGLSGLVLLLGVGIGVSLLRRLCLTDSLTALERVLFSLPLGLGVISSGVMGLGLAGLLRPWAILVWLAFLAALTWREWGEAVRRLSDCANQLPAGWRSLGRAEKAIAGVFALLLALCLTQALTPPWDYDGLMYHLQGPRLFLQAGRITLLTDLWQANGPFTVEMLYTVGLAFGCDTFARLMHLSYAVILALATGALGARLVGKRAGWIAAAVLVGQPIFPLWAGLAYVDIAWSAYEFLGLYVVLVWAERRAPRLLALAGLLIGYGAGSKYLGLGGAAVAGVLLLWFSRKEDWRALLTHVLLLGLPALLVASPWYLKNWIWAGNPVYPLYFGGKDWDATRFGLLITYLRSFGVGHQWYDYLLLPYSLYARRGQFGTMMGSIDMPSPLFLLALLCLLTRRPRRLAPLGLAALLRFGLWALGSHQQRFLLPVLPTVSLLTAAVLVETADRLKWRRLGEIVAAGLVGGMLVATVAYSLLAFVQKAPFSVIVGAESKSAFLGRAVEGFKATQFIQDTLPADERALMLWDGRGYYCDARCVADSEASLWTQLVLAQPGVPQITTALRARGLTHLLFNERDADFWLQHDPNGDHRRAVEFFLQKYRPACTRELFQDDWTQVYEITCVR